jgi:hypothetical protein
MLLLLLALLLVLASAILVGVRVVFVCCCLHRSGIETIYVYCALASKDKWLWQHLPAAAAPPPPPIPAAAADPAVTAVQLLRYQQHEKFFYLTSYCTHKLYRMNAFAAKVLRAHRVPRSCLV